MTSVRSHFHTFISTALILILCCGLAARTSKAGVTEGVVDLVSSADQDGVTVLSGEWRYVWGQLQVPLHSADNADGFYVMPNTWDMAQKSFSAQSGRGYASFSITLENLRNDVFWGIYIPEQSTAFRLYLGERLIASGGEVATDRSHAKAYSGNQVVEIGLLDDTEQLTLQVSNFHHNSGGPWQPLSFGPYSVLNDRSSKAYFQESLVVSLMFIASLFLLTQWLIDRREISSFILAILALVVTVRLGISDSQPIYKLLGSPPWWLHVRTLYISKLVAIPLLLTWFYRIYPNCFNIHIIKFCIAAFAVACAIVVVSDPLVFTAFLSPFLVQIAVAMLYTIGCVVRLLLQRQAGTVSIAIGSAVLFACTTYEILIYSQWIISDRASVLPIGILVFLLSLTVNLIYLRANEKRQVEALSQELLLVNQTLESKVEERTQQLAEKATALEDANRQLQLLANFDDLTQLLNRRAFIDQCKLAAQTEPTVSLILIDVDLFKRVNDQFGHAAGDKVLVKLARLLSSMTYKSHNKVARFGGEEFVVLLPDTDLDTTTRICSKMVQRVRELRFDDVDGLSGITISAGIATGKLTPDGIDKLIQQADNAMYRAKNNGRDGYQQAA